MHSLRVPSVIDRAWVSGTTIVSAGHGGAAVKLARRVLDGLNDRGKGAGGSGSQAKERELSRRMK